MARPKKRPVLTHCRVSATANPRAPWRVWFPKEEGGQKRRVFKSFAREESAWDFAEDKDLEISNHGVRFADITGEARRAFDHYRDQVIELEPIGLSLPTFEKLVADCIADFRQKHEAAHSITIAEGIETFMAYKKTRVGKRQIGCLKGYLKRFAKDFGDRPFQSITADEIVSWLALLQPLRKTAKSGDLLSPDARNNHRNALGTLFAYAVAPARSWCRHNPVSDVEAEKVNTTEPRAYSVSDVTSLMQTAHNARPDLLPALALGMFAGLRISEVFAIDLSTLSNDDDEIRVGADRKTGARLAPFTDTCKAWLFAQPRRAGEAWVGNENDFYEAMRELFTLSGVEKIDNGARHSFISYRCAETRDIARVADECGTSVRKIKDHYRKIVTESEAKKFFGIRPEKRGRKSKITNIETGRVSA